MLKIFRTLPKRSIAPQATCISGFSVLRTSISPAAFTQRRKMSENILAKDIVPPVGPYSHAVKTPTAIYCSGQIHLTPEGEMLQGTITEKTALCFKNLKAVLAAAGSSVEKIVKVNVFLADMADFAEMNKEYEKWMTHKPARSCVAVKTLPKNADVEIECVALP